MSEENKIGYYAVIPATILFNKDLKANEKLLYAIITILSNKEGYCFASNAYLSNLLDAQPHTVNETYTPSDEIETVEPFYIKIDRDSNGVIKEYVENDAPFESYL